MRDGYVRTAAITPKVRVADCEFNIQQIKNLMMEAFHNHVGIAVFPELCITGYTCGDLFLQEPLLCSALDGLLQLKEYSRQCAGMITFVGLPYVFNQKLYNVAAAVMNGKILGMVPKMSLPNYGEFYEKRQFTEGFSTAAYTMIDGESIPIGQKVLFTFEGNEYIKIGAEICEDLWGPAPPSICHALNGADIVVNLSASNEVVGKGQYRKDLVKGQSARLVCAYIYAGAGEGESTQDVVFGGHNLICENGVVLAESEKFSNQSIYADIDVQKICSERRRMTTFHVDMERHADNGYKEVKCPALTDVHLELIRYFDKSPFVPANQVERDNRCEEILNIQSYGLKKRLSHTGCERAVIGLSGGLDSTLALLVTVRAFDLLTLSRSGIICVTMPCFGTTDRTYGNAVALAQKLGCSLREINIVKSVRQHFEDIGQDESNHDVTYENAQARERTQILMDIANQVNGMVIGTGDMSELALGWATYNGDHMSMYGVNASVPKTLVRHVVRYYADTCNDTELKKILMDVLDTPVSPELLPPDRDGTIAQKTEDLVGPYELHDFFMYHMLRFGIGPSKMFRIAKLAFDGDYEDAVIYKWLRTFIRRFFSQQFKRSCLPDGPKVGSVAVSPRGDLRMPSDASAGIWMRELDNIKEENGFTQM